MELFNLKTSENGKLAIQEKVDPKRFKEIGGKQEKDLVKMIVENPWLLNLKLEDEESDLRENPELLIIGEEARTIRGKRPDLLAIDQKGNLIVIEAKRDIDDEKARKEAVEFQAIRYAAASRKMTPDDIIDLFANYLEKTDYLENTESDKSDPRRKEPWKEQAIELLCAHLSDEEDLEEEDLNELLDPRNKQKIYLVAADYDPEITSACAWLREHDIDIVCFRLRPYRIGEQWLLERERLIPPPELDDFMLEMAPTTDSSRGYIRSSKEPSDKPKSCIWLDDPENPVTVSKWKDILRLGTKKALELGLSEDDLPMNHSADGKDFYSPTKIKENLFVDLHGSAPQIRKFLSDMFRNLDKEKGFLQILTQSGASYELPD